VRKNLTTFPLDVPGNALINSRFSVVRHYQLYKWAVHDPYVILIRKY